MKNLKNSNFVLILILLAICFVLSSCQDEEYLLDTKTNIDRYEGGIVLENPYATTNMKIALDTIKAKIARGEYSLKRGENAQKTNSSLLDQFNISTSHRYVKFTPQSEAEVALLKQDSTLLLSDYPLDYEFDDSFFNNRPELPEGVFPEYFASVPISKSLPNVNNLQLAELYIPEDDVFFNGDIATPITKKTIINNEEDLLHHLLYEAYSLVGKEQELLEDKGAIIDPVTQQERWIFGRKWYPSGHLKVWDGIGGTTSGGQICNEVITGYDETQCTGPGFISLYDCIVPIYGTVCTTTQIPGGGFTKLVGAKVLMRQWFTVRSAISNVNGYFTTGSVRGKARYIIQWERYQYSIRNGSIFQAETRGPKVKSARWTHNIMGGDDEYHAMIHTAAFDYYYGDRYGLKSPPENGFFKSQLKIAAREINGKSSHAKARKFYNGANISLREWGSPSDIVYGVTIHELAHAAHHDLDQGTYANIVWDAWINPCLPSAESCDHPGPTGDNNRRLLETWASTVETLFARRRYRERFTVDNYTYKENNLQLQFLEQRFYTSTFVDMLEGNYDLNILNQGLGNVNRPIDRVNGYTINQLENALINSSSWWEWRDRIFNLYPNNPTRNNLNELFNNW